MVTVEISETALIPAATVLGNPCGTGARRQGFVHKLIYLTIPRFSASVNGSTRPTR